MAFVLEFPDSELRDVVRVGASVRLRCAAAAVRNDVGERGWLTSVQLELTGATLHGDATHAFGRIAEGRLRHGDRHVEGPAVPGDLVGDVELSLRLANGTQLTVHGDALAIHVDPSARFAPDLSC